MYVYILLFLPIQLPLFIYATSCIYLCIPESIIIVLNLKSLPTFSELVLLLQPSSLIIFSTLLNKEQSLQTTSSLLDSPLTLPPLTYINLQVKIADFGVSTMLQSTIAQCNSFVGTSAYLSPERINPSPHGDGRYNAYKSDIWSLGLTLLELYMGRYPYTEFQPGQVLPFFSLYNAIVRNDPPQAPPECSWYFKDFIAKCLTKDVASRPSVSDLIRHPFAAMYEEPQFQDLRAILPR